ncbi:MAG: site-specific DNA-methyltransferase [Paludibacteraceae bacterium]|nr:site-specific DNA-methyltransferase [Paludibacteraceae bacterium]
MSSGLAEIKKDLIATINQRVVDRILEQANADLLIKLISQADTIEEANNIAAFGTTYKRTGFHFDKRLEKISNNIKFKKKNEDLSFVSDESRPTHELIIGDNYDALQNLLITHMGKVDVIYIDPPYGKDSMGEFANTNYNNAITRDNLLSMLYPRLQLAKHLLSEDGVIFCSIDDKNQAYVKCLFDEVFGEVGFLMNVPRITKKGGKSTDTIAKNNDYILAYTKIKSSEIVFSQEDKTDLKKYKYEDEYVSTRGRYALTQTLDYNSLQYSSSMDYKIEIDGQIFVPGSDEKMHYERLNGNHGVTDWVWRWSKDAVEWGKKEGFFVVKNNRIYTKSYLYCRKKNGKCEIENIEATKAFTSLSYIDNHYSNDNAKKELDTIFINGSSLFKNPKPSILISKLIDMVMRDNDSAVILDFFAGSGTTGHAVMELNRQDGGNRKFILCQVNEKTKENPNGIAYDVTTKRLKRIMSGECYDGTKDFPWLQKNAPYMDNLNVYEIGNVSQAETREGETAFDKIDETCYGLPKFENFADKVAWICENFENTTKFLKKSKED